MGFVPPKKIYLGGLATAYAKDSKWQCSSGI